MRYLYPLPLALANGKDIYKDIGL